MVKLPVGTADFETIRRNGYYYIDKSRIISELIRDGASAILFTRPRRFGKTTIMTMLSSFFDITKESASLFEDLDVAQDEEAVKLWLNQYPVIFLSLKNVDGLTFKSAIGRLKSTLHLLFNDYTFLLEDEINDWERKLINAFISGDADIDDMKDSLAFLTRMLSTHYGKDVIILVDEYDVPLSRAEQNGYYDEMLDLVRAMFSVLKDDSHVKMAILTGCLRISKESLFTGLNNLTSYSLLSESYASYFGFTDSEVRKLLEDTDLGEKEAVIRSWYDGYNIGGLSIYSAWDVVSYIKDLLVNRDAEPMNYWANTSGNEIIRRFIDDMHSSVSDDYGTLISKGAIEKRISENLAYNDLYSSENNVWSLLLETGYLTIKTKYAAGKDTALIIPNEEVRDLFIANVNSWFMDSMGKEDRSELFNALFEGDENKLSDIISNYLERTISYFDYSEEFYHAFTAGLFSSKKCYVKSNRESGLGRYDLLVADKDARKAAVLEFKAVKREKDITSSLDKALNQIDERKYDLDLNRYNLICYAVVFYKKSAYVKKI